MICFQNLGRNKIAETDQPQNNILDGIEPWYWNIAHEYLPVVYIISTSMVIHNVCSEVVSYPPQPHKNDTLGRNSSITQIRFKYSNATELHYLHCIYTNASSVTFVMIITNAFEHGIFNNSCLAAKNKIK